ncbi:unnamed protein product [Oppiella nova]|uniref:AB hydrolase-1 domain-containing protein n=1 Tax=Oppiella nova TaxID=334625 RepID=A0A7R9QYJ3_9ACAR|nr:unnamed protein product [Oppiella nova]CAG2178855.1 unnamed protein product [Oppiella nova]
MKEFAKDYHVIAVDNRGYGDTDKPTGTQNYTIDQIVEDTRQLVEALNKRDIILVAHDWGGIVGWGMAAKYPELVQKLVIINSPHPGMFRRKSWKQFLYSWYMLFFSLPVLPEFALKSNDYFAFDYSFINGNGRPLLPDDQLEAYKYTFHKNGFTAPLNWYRASIKRYPPKNPLPKNMQIKVPTLIVWGKKDKYLTSQLAEAHEHVDDLTLHYIENCSHWTQMDQPDLVNKYMRQFLVKK